MANQFLDKDGLDKVAEKVNTRLKTVTEMPATANEGAVRLYVGESDSSYTKGHTYQYQTNSWVDITPAGGGSAADKLTWGTELPTTGMVDGEPFLYTGPDSEGYEAVAGALPTMNPQELGWYESDGSSGYQPSTDTFADVERFAYYNGSIMAYVLKETPEVGDMVYSIVPGSSVEELGAVTEYSPSEGIKFGDNDYFFSRYSGMDSPGKTYYQFVALKSGAIYQYDGTEDKWVLKSSSGDAAAISYENADYPDLNNVEKALDNLISKIYYVEPKVNSFTMAPSTDTYEIGSTVNELVFNWTYNKAIVSQTLTDCILADETVRSATYSTPITSNKTFTLTASDGENSVSSNKSISFKHKVYWGAASEPASFDSAFILALTGKKFATNYKGSYNMNLGEGQYGYLAYPSSWGMVDSWYIGGFEATTYDCGTIQFTNASGNTTTFRIVRTTQPSLGSITAEVR